MKKENSIQKVISGNFCVGCGACAFVLNSKMSINEFGEYIPSLNYDLLDTKAQETIEFVCPSLNPEKNEDFLAKKFSSASNYDKKIGNYESLLGGYVQESNYRESGTSGGFGTWIGVELLKKGLIDGVIHVKSVERHNANSPFFSYQISKNISDIHSGSKTRYHVVELSEILKLIKENPGQYLFIGVSCMVKAIRRIQLIDKDIQDSIPFTISLVCGHLKSINWTLSLAWMKGVVPKETKSFQYRTKGDDIPARAYYYKINPNENNETTMLVDSADVVGGKFNQGALMLPACNYCDDVLGDTADMTIGDAWLPRFEIDKKGNNLLIVRNKILSEIISSANSEKRVNISQLTVNEVIDSQAGGFRQKGEGLWYRIILLKKKNKWHPEKRINNNQYRITFLRKRIYRERMQITELSRIFFVKALKENDISIYQNNLRKKLSQLRKIEIISSSNRIIRKKIVSLFLKTLRK